MKLKNKGFALITAMVMSWSLFAITASYITLTIQEKRLVLASQNILRAEALAEAALDEVMWEKANILLKLGRFEEAVTSLKRIVAEYQYDILADDANFLIGKIYEEDLKKLDQAQEYYRKQLEDYPGSVYNVDARKRFRKLRGDKIN